MAKEKEVIVAEVQEPEKGVAAEAQGMPEQGGQAAVEAAGSGEPAVGEAAAPVLSARDRYRGRIKEDYPDLDIDN